MEMCGFFAGCPAGESISPLLTTGYYTARGMVLCNALSLRPDAVWRLIWITPCKPQAQLGVSAIATPATAKQLNCYAVQAAVRDLYPELRYACTGLSTLDAIRRRPVMHKTMPCAV
jgi:hypothetical protein